MRYIIMSIFLFVSFHAMSQVRQVGLNINTEKKLSLVYSQQEKYLRFEVEAGMHKDNFFSSCLILGNKTIKSWSFLAGLGMELRRERVEEPFKAEWLKRNVFQASVIKTFCNSELQLNYRIGDNYPYLQLRQYIK